MSVDYGKIILGEPIKCIVRIKPPINFQREDIRVIGNTLSITDTNNRILEEFDVADAFGPEYQIAQIFENIFRPYLSPFIQGFSCSFFAFGSQNSGKTQTIEGNRKEPGLIILMSDSLFNLLETKKYHSNQTRSGNIQNYNYGVRVRYIEIIDEEIHDLLGRPGMQIDNLHLVESIWEGPTVQNTTWITVNNAAQINEVMLNGSKNRNLASNEFGKMSSKSSGIFTIELLQTAELVDTKENLVLISRMNFFDLPASDILLDDPETIRVRQGSTLNKSIISLGSLMKDLSSKRNDYVLYETSTVSHLMKDVLGGNSLTVGIFCVQNGDTRGSTLTLNFLKYARNIFNYPVVNDAKAFGLIKKYRAEANGAKNNAARQIGGGGGGGGGYNGSLDGFNQGSLNQTGIGNMNDNGKLIELEKKLIENHLDKMRQADDKQRLAAKLADIREKYNLLIKEKADLQGDLIKSEEEKLEVSKALVELQIENTRLMEIIQNEKYEQHNKLLNAEQDVLGLNIREEQALKKLQEMQDRFKDVVEDKRELEIEFVALKKNYIHMNQQLEEEKLKNQNVGMELINMVNENKALHDEMNDIYKKTGSQGDENSRFLNKIEKLEAENQEQREALVFAKAEIERLKTEMLKYDIMEQQHRLELDTKKIDMEKGYMEITKDRQNEYSKMNKETEFNIRKIKDEKLLWESQKMELTHKNKLAQRKIAEMDDRLNEMHKQMEEMQSDNNKLSLLLDEKTSVFRKKLLEFTAEMQKGGQEKPTRIGYDLNAREELIRTYTEKEIDLNEKLDKERKQLRNKEMEIRALKQYTRQIKYLAEDWAPVGVPLPEILCREPPTKLDDNMMMGGGGYQNNNQSFDQMGMIGGDQNEVGRLRQHNKKLQEDLRMMQEQMSNQAYRNTQGENDISKRLINEIEYMKGHQDIIRRPGSSNMEIEQIRRERNDLQEENRRLVGMLKDSKKWDIYLLQRDNERLVKALKEHENGAVGPISGDGDQNQLRMKVMHYEKTVKQLEKERSELMVRATMAEEQLKSLQEHLNKATLDYQKKIVELKKSNARNGNFN